MHKHTFVVAVALVALGAAVPASSDPLGAAAITLRAPSTFTPGAPVALSGTLTLAGAPAPSQPVTVYIDGEPAETVLTDSDGAFSSSISLVFPPAAHVVQAVAYDGTPLQTRSALLRLDVARHTLELGRLVSLQSGFGSGELHLSPTSLEGCATDACSRTPTYAAGTVVALTAVPDPGSAFYGWSSACEGTEPECSVSMDGDKTVLALFGAASPDLWVDAAPQATPVKAGDEIGFHLTFGNSGSIAHNARLTASLPTGPGFSWSLADDDPSCSITDMTLTCSFAELHGGIARQIRVVSPTRRNSVGAYETTVWLVADDHPEVTASGSVEIVR